MDGEPRTCKRCRKVSRQQVFVRVPRDGFTTVQKTVTEGSFRARARLTADSDLRLLRPPVANVTVKRYQQPASPTFMDRTYIESQQIVARYLSGDLTVREARQFEKYCLDNPDWVRELPIPMNLKAKMVRKPGENLDSADAQNM